MQTITSTTTRFLLTILGFTAILASLLSVNVYAKGGVKTIDQNCDQITSFTAVDGQYLGGYGIQASYTEKQCVSGKTRTKITLKNMSSGRIEASTPLDFDRSQITFYAVARDTDYEITITIRRDSDNYLIGTETVTVHTAQL